MNLEKRKFENTYGTGASSPSYKAMPQDIKNSTQGILKFVFQMIRIALVALLGLTFFVFVGFVALPLLLLFFLLFGKKAHSTSVFRVQSFRS